MNIKKAIAGTEKPIDKYTPRGMLWNRSPHMYISMIIDIMVTGVVSSIFLFPRTASEPDKDKMISKISINPIK